LFDVTHAPAIVPLSSLIISVERRPSTSSIQRWSAATSEASRLK
jgi:hypothetical protein